MAQRAEQEGGVGGRGGGGGVGALRRRRAASPRRPGLRPPPQGGRLHLRPAPSPSQKGKTALGIAKKIKYKTQHHTEVIKILENPAAYFAAQVGRAAPHAVPQPLLCIYRLL